MSVSKSCPIEYKTVDKNIIRINAMIIFSILLLFIITNNPVFLIIIGTDFIVRVFFGLKYSPFCFVIKRILRLSGIKPHKINAGPKSFAAKIGLIFSVLIAIFYFFDLEMAVMFVSIVFLIASGLDAFFDFCIACKIYPYYNKIFGNTGS